MLNYDQDIPSTISEQVEYVEELDISYRAMHESLYITNDQKQKKILVPFSSITNKYRHFLSDYIIEWKLTVPEQRKFRYQPKTMSNALYGTTEFWAELLVLNRVYSINMFKPKVARIYDPNRFKSVLNELLILEEIYEDNYNDEDDDE